MRSGRRHPRQPGEVPHNLEGKGLIGAHNLEPLVQKKGNLRERTVTCLKNACQSVKTAFQSETAKKVGKIALYILAALAVAACIVGAPFTGGLSILVPLTATMLVLSIIVLHEKVRSLRAL